MSNGNGHTPYPLPLRRRRAAGTVKGDRHIDRAGADAERELHAEPGASKFGVEADRFGVSTGTVESVTDARAGQINHDAPTCV